MRYEVLIEAAREIRGIINKYQLTHEQSYCIFMEIFNLKSYKEQEKKEYLPDIIYDRDFEKNVVKNLSNYRLPGEGRYCRICNKEIKEIKLICSECFQMLKKEDKEV